ncbi:MAG TPA: TIM-barrel domain-containing protein [Tepidisphaeraceae bacterium]|jgi:alpha-D-xyloside xylohydrolase
MKKVVILMLIGVICGLGSCVSTTKHALSRPQLRENGSAVAVRIGDGWLMLQECGDRIIHVMYGKEAFARTEPDLDVVTAKMRRPTWRWEGDETLVVSTGRINARVALDNGQISFTDANGHAILAEDGRTLTPTLLDGEQTFHVQQKWQSDPDEALYGLGQNQLGLTDIKGYDFDLWQHNGTIYIPFFLSTRGYGILWNNPSLGRFGDLRPCENVPTDNLSGGVWKAEYFRDKNFAKPLKNRDEQTVWIEERPDINGIPTQRTDTPVDRLPENQGAIRWSGEIVPAVSGAYQFQTYSNGGVKVWIAGKLVINHWRQNWLPWYDLAKVQLTAGKKYPIKVEWDREQGTVMQLRWKTPAASDDISLWSDVGKQVDYYFVQGNTPDEIISGYRELTGKAPMMPIWAFGLWQSRQRYETAQQSLDVVKGFRERQIPFDNIVQDWQYWPKDAWGSHEFDRQRFPDPNNWIKAIHDLHARLMISVWGKFYTGTKNFDAVQAHGFLYQPNLEQHIRDWLGYEYTFFDAFNPAARDLFWKQVKTALFDRGVDAWWLDATEPDIAPTPTIDAQMSLMNPTALGPGRKVLNGYSIMMGRTFHDHQLAAAPDQRVFILTRNAFASQQRNAAAVWSGDTSCTWTAMRKQIAAGISYCMSGLPYWTMDIGGFTPPAKFAVNNFNARDFAEWCELSTRWFEFGTFCPLLRVHGEGHVREMWEFGGDHSPAYAAQLKFDRLRYRLLPYIYSLAGDVTQNNGTMMRGLAMDFPTDRAAREITDQYMFGPAFLVAPVTRYLARSQELYLPVMAPTLCVGEPGLVKSRPLDGWYNFWTGQFFLGGQRVRVAAPLDEMPLFVRAGSIISMGPELQYTTEKVADPITLMVYTGANGKFSFYEDDGMSNAYEHGKFSRIPIRWDENERTLSIGKRVGEFKGLPPERIFNVVFISPNKATPFSLSPSGVREVRYVGKVVTVQ